MTPQTAISRETTVNKSAVIGTIFGITVATAVAGIAGYKLSDDDAGSATVAQQECYETQLEQMVTPRDEQRIAGTVIGADGYPVSPRRSISACMHSETTFQNRA
jgi:hypothetical protein